MEMQKTDPRCEAERDGDEYLDGGISTAVEDLPCLNGLDCSHLVWV